MSAAQEHRATPLDERVKALRRARGSVQWTLPGRKRPFATSTTATSALARALAEDGNPTFAQVIERIHFDEDLRTICEYFCDRGYAETPMQELIG